jgi:formylglycine-generating enzyme required for sulfatase activity
MHAETFAYILHQLDYERKMTPAPAPNVGTSRAADRRMVEIPAGAAQLGLDGESSFGWDNEFQALAVDVPAFSMAKHKVTNGEYLEFVREDGAAPFFWVERAGRWFHRGMFSEIPLPLDWPVYVTHQQASDYVRWRSGMEYRNFTLPTEAQFHRASEGASPVNANFERWDPVPVAVGTNGAGGESTHGVAQTIGNGWEWTSTVFAPFPGFQPFPFYPGYSADFFDGKHFVMKGGSPRTARALLRPSFRNWFRADYPYVYAGFRMVENAVEGAVKHGEIAVENAVEHSEASV